MIDVNLLLPVNARVESALLNVINMGPLCNFKA